MNGIQLIRLLDVVPITEWRNAPGVHPRSVILRSTRFVNIEEVLFNGITSPSFVVYSETELIAEVPEPLQDAVLTDVAVLSATPSMTERSLIEFTVGTKIRVITGSQRLIQNFVRLLLRTAGSNIFHKELGGSLYTNVRGNVTSRVAADVAISVGNVKQQIIAAQSVRSDIPASERLLSAEIAGVTEDPSNTSVYVTIILTSHSRQRSAATFVG